MANFIRPMSCKEDEKTARRKIHRAIITTHAYDFPYGGEIHPNVDVEFWRGGSGKEWKDYEDISPKNFRRLNRALSEVHPNRTAAYSKDNCLCVHYHVS